MSSLNGKIREENGFGRGNVTRGEFIKLQVWCCVAQHFSINKTTT